MMLGSLDRFFPDKYIQVFKIQRTPNYFDLFYLGDSINAL